MKSIVASHTLATVKTLSNEIHLLDYPAWIFEEKTLCITDANRKALEFCLYDRHELIGLSIYELWHNEDLLKILDDLVVNHYERSFFGNLKHSNKNGEVVMIRVRATRLPNPGTSWVVHLVNKPGGY